MGRKIRKMTEKDRAEVLNMMRVFYTSPAVLTDGSEEIYARDVDACLGGNPYLEGYIIEGDAGTGGYGMIAKSFSTEFGKMCIWIEDLYLKEECRGQGLGKLFLDFVAETYKDCIFRLEAEAENKRAIRLYEKCGFSALPYLEMKK